MVGKGSKTIFLVGHEYYLGKKEKKPKKLTLTNTALK